MGSNQLGFKELAFVNLKIQNVCPRSCWKSTSSKMWLVWVKISIVREIGNFVRNKLKFVGNTASLKQKRTNKQT